MSAGDTPCLVAGLEHRIRLTLVVLEERGSLAWYINEELQHACQVLTVFHETLAFRALLAEQLHVDGGLEGPVGREVAVRFELRFLLIC